MLQITQEDFLLKVDKNGPIHPVCGQCWVWIAGLDNGNYGKIKVRGKSYRAHRVAFELEYGEFPDEMWVLHKCDNTVCVNPAHLFLGTVVDNNKDMWEKGRERVCYGDDNGARLHPERLSRGDEHGKLIAANCARGVTHYLSRLTAEQVVDIRNRAAAGKWGINKLLAEEYGVSQTVIHNIVKRHTYTDVE